MWAPVLQRVHGLGPDALDHYRPPELSAVIKDAREREKVETIQAETMMRLAAWLEAQDG